MTLKPGIKKYTAFATSVKSLEPDVQCFLASGAPESSPAEGTNKESVATHDLEETLAANDGEDGLIVPVDFERQPEVVNVFVERDIPLENSKDKMLRIHVRTGHLSFAKIRAMARRGEVPH
jgi:hypothetical protein